MSTVDKLNEALFEILVTNDKAREELFAIIDEFKTKYPRSYKRVCKNHSIGCAVIEAIEEAEAFIKEMEAEPAHKEEGSQAEFDRYIAGDR